MHDVFSEGNSLSGVKAVQWGIDHEAEALKSYCEATQNSVRNSGLWLHECGYLGASPDGLIGDNIVVEVKCPYRARNKLIDTIAQEDKAFCLEVKDSSLFLKKNHAYYHQIQGQMYLTGRTECHLVIWSPQQTVIIIEPRDDVWGENIRELQAVFKDLILPEILSAHSVK